MAEPTANLRLPLALGLTATAFTAGLNSSGSFWVVPRLLESPTPVLLRQFRKFYATGRDSMVPLSLGVTLNYFYIAYQYYSHYQKFPTLAVQADWKYKMYLLAGLLAISIQPYTVLFIKGTNDKLFALGDGAEAKGAKDSELSKTDGETAHALLDHWGVVNLGRSLLLVVSAGVATWTALA